MARDLYQTSIEIIKANQSRWGSYVASPAFPTYQFCWLRDGSFIAHAMDSVGEFNSAEAYFRWTGNTITKYRMKVETIRQIIRTGNTLGKDDALHTRFTLDGWETHVDEEWGNFQIDGYGTWLWALSEHVHQRGQYHLLEELSEAIDLTVQYLDLVWRLPNYDCWEEHPEYLHPYTLATVYAGFNCVSELVQAGNLRPLSVETVRLATEVKDFILKYGMAQGRLVKHIQPAGPDSEPGPVAGSGVDSSLLGLALPFNVLTADDPIMRATLQAIEDDLHRHGGGIYRYKEDVYYGGGEWALLSAWLGWYYAEVGEIAKAEALQSWIESCADADGNLPEQVNDHVLAPEHYDPWVKKWGKVAKPLLWSHAMYILLVNAIERGKSK